MELQRIVIITGPTAGGKTACAVAWARRFGGEIINADSQQVYRHLNIGTSKPDAEQQLQAVHHLIDCVEPDAHYNAGRYAQEAAAAAAQIAARGKSVFVCGGSGLYIRALLQGLSPALKSDPHIRAQLEAEHQRESQAGNPNYLHKRLQGCDPVSAKRLHPNDIRRIQRALEITISAGSPASEVLRETNSAPRYDALHLALDPGREQLNARINIRCDQMLAAGLLQEVRELRRRGYGPELPSMRAIGYRHMQPVIEGRETLANVAEQMKHATRQYARRQRTWLRALPDVIWLHPQNDADASARRIAQFLGE